MHFYGQNAILDLLFGYKKLTAGCINCQMEDISAAIGHADIFMTVCFFGVASLGSISLNL
jgi:hypothetical protein